MSIQRRYWDKVQAGLPDECWIWTAAKTPSGYGKMWTGERIAYAHHLAMIFDGRERPEGMIALHACNNPSCVNPRHLSWGTQTENMRQALQSGRAPHAGRVPGEKNGNAKLSEDNVRLIRKDQRPRNVVAEEYGVTASLISAIHYRRAWKHVL